MNGIPLPYVGSLEGTSRGEPSAQDKRRSTA